jgi:hypothetical protein
MPFEDIIMHILRMRAGQVVPIHEIASIVAKNTLNPMRNCTVSYEDRTRIQGQIFRTAMALARQKKIKNYRHPSRKRGILHAGIRINEAFV